MSEDRERGRRRWTTAAAIVVVLGAVAVIGGVWLTRSSDPVAPEIGGTFGPVLAEVQTCRSVPPCPDLPVEQALDQIVAWIDDEPAITVLEVHEDRSPSEDLPPGALPATGRVVVRIDRTPDADRLLADLVALPVVNFVALGTADQPPADLQVQERPDDPEQGRTLGQVSVPVQGSDEPIVYEIWEPVAGTICHGRRPDPVRCSQLAVDTGPIHATYGSPEQSPGCLSVVTGPGVDHVRVTEADGTRLEVATTQLVPDLTILELHVACWTDPTSGVRGEVVAPDGSVLVEVP